MYDYEYENDVLLMLRVLKYLHKYEPAVFVAIMKHLEDVDFDGLYDNMYFILWNVFEVEMADEDEEDSYGCGMMYMGHPVLNEFLKLSYQYCDLSGDLPASYRKKLQDIILFHLVATSASIYDYECRYEDTDLCVAIWFTDCYDLPGFLAGLVDLVMYVQQENERLQRQIDNLYIETDTDRTWEEAA